MPKKGTQKSSVIKTIDKFIFLDINRQYPAEKQFNPTYNTKLLKDSQEVSLIISDPTMKQALKIDEMYASYQQKNKDEGNEKVLLAYTDSDDLLSSFPLYIDNDKEGFSYFDVLNLLSINDLDDTSTLCEITNITKDEKNDIYIMTVKAICKYDVLGVTIKAKTKTGSKTVDFDTLENHRHVTFRDVLSLEVKKIPPLKPEHEVEQLEPYMEEIEGLMEIFTQNNLEWTKITFAYMFINLYPIEKIMKITQQIASDKINEYQNMFTANPAISFLGMLIDFVAVTPRLSYEIYRCVSAQEKFLILRTLFVTVVDLVDRFLKTLKKGFEIRALEEAVQNVKKSEIYTTITLKKEKDFLHSLVMSNYEVVNKQLMDNYKKRVNINLAFDDELRDLARIITSATNPDITINSNDAEVKNMITDEILETELNQKIKNNLDKQQKEFLLREKMKAIKESLSENDENADEEDEEFTKIIKDPVLKQIYPESVLKLIKTEKVKLKSMMSASPEANILATYLNQIKKLPWRKVEVESLDIKKARDILDKNHYGLKEVKERIIEYLSLIINHKNINKQAAQKELINIDDKTQIDLSLFRENEDNKKVQTKFNNVPILTLVGPPGTGKTSLARAIAEALNKSYVKISLGGVHDEAEIRGHRKTYVGAMPGKIIKAIQQAGVSNPLILLDEIDKMASDIKGDPASAMLEVLDPEQNSKFQDNYIEHEYDLSKVLFIATANYYENIPVPLLDRVEIIELNSYTTNEKIRIAREHLIDAVIEQAGLKPEQFQIDDKVVEFIIKHYTAEAGVRSLKRNLDKIARKIVTQIVEGKKIKDFVITEDIAKEFLGTPKISDPENEQEPQVGSVNGLAYTSIGGTTLQIEVSTFKSKQPGIRLTGSLKEVMQESAKIALSYVRANAEKFGIKDFDFDEYEIHVHVPEGAVPKDGPSAGVTFTTALISALSKKPVSPKVAMTGEITLRGKVLEIGGLKEKSFAAYKKGVKTVFIPKGNEKNLVDIPEEVKAQINFIPVKSYEEIYDVLFKDVKPIK